ncbi:MAG: FAD-binding protein [Paludibacteraceae bacterium]|nr:FAD-binding protein [Paludibacteraceae bacterium]
MEILTDALHRIAYATDASAYREMPTGVAYPRNEEDMKWLLSEAKRRHTCLIPRAGGTSIAGQVVGNGIMADVSRYMNHILEINAEQQWVRVQPGVVRDELNIALRPYGLFFSPETSTSNRCCIGGMVGNNSCGTHSLVYGSTRHHVIGLKGLLSDGTTFEIQNYELRMKSELGERIVKQLKEWKADEKVQELLRENFPDTSLKRRSCGYALDEALSAKDEVDLCKLIVGSEGTLCLITEITLSLDPLPPAHKMVVCEMLDDLNEAWDANLYALQQKPVAVELIDGKILELAKGNLSAEKNMEVLGLDKEHLPAGILVSEFWAETIDELQQKAAEYINNSSATVRFAVGSPSVRRRQDTVRPSVDCRSTVGKDPIQPPIKILFDTDVEKVWNLRKAGLGVLTGSEGDAKPVGVIEDTAVAPERLGAYMADFEQMMHELGLDCVYYGHISTGELHLRPILNLKNADDRKKFRQVAEETAKLVKKHHGSLSGEHGDGRLRGEFIPLMYGEEVYEMFRQLKKTWDPDGLLNMGKIVDTPPMDEYLRYGIGASEGKVASDLLRRIERCNGAGDCRKSNLIGGTMCPAYKVSGDELWTTRARANVLREKLTRDPKGVTSEEVAEVLDSCLACKGCRSECPSNVDMTRLRSEILQLKYDRDGTPLRSWMVARMAMVEQLGSIVPNIYNWFARTQWTAKIIKRIVRFSVHRQIPTLSRHSMRWLVAHSIHKTTEQTKGKIYLFADEFTNYQEAELGLKFAQLASALGYEVEIPKHVESGRAAISKGCLHLAAKYAKKNVQLLADIISDETPMVGIEPSCILSFRDEYPHLVHDGALRLKSEKLAKNSLLYDEWIMREVKKRNISATDFAELKDTDIWLHGHCHQKALVGVEQTAECLRLTGANVHVIPSGCCGMAGSFGYEKEHYETSMAIGEMVLFPAVRKAVSADDKSPNHTIVCAPGTSCRQQILDGTGVRAIHPIEVLLACKK